MPSPVRLADLTTLRLGGPARDLVTATNPDELAALVGAADADGRPVLVLGGGSNLVVADDGIDARVVRVGLRGVTVQREAGGTDGSALITIAAGEPWDEVVAQLTADGFSGFAPLAGIPGSTGATPVQNVGAYGTEIADVLVAVTLYDRATRTISTVPAADLGLGYRTSVLRGTDRAVILDVTVRLHLAPLPVRYSELAGVLGVPPGGSAPPARVREAVLALRRAKGMVLDPQDRDTWSVGSFFTNPILDPEAARTADEAIRVRCGPGTTYPAYPVQSAPGPVGSAGERGAVKLSAAWLIERAGFAKGHLGPGGRVAISSKHTLALTNRGGSTADLLELARSIRDGVREQFAVDLHPEPILVGVSLG